MGRLLCLGVRPLQAIAIVLTAVGDVVCLLTLELIAAHSLRLSVADELGAARRLLNRVLPANHLRLLAGRVDPVHRGGRRIRLGPGSVALLQVLVAVADDCTARSNDRLALLLLEKLGHQLVVLIRVLVLVRHASAVDLLASGCLHLLHLLPHRLLLLHLLDVLLLLALNDQSACRA